MSHYTVMNKCLCPRCEGDKLVWMPYGAVRCTACQVDFEVTELKQIPMDNSIVQKDPANKPKVYGHLN